MSAALFLLHTTKPGRRDELVEGVTRRDLRWSSTG